jgi:hypothetical protein
VTVLPLAVLAASALLGPATEPSSAAVGYRYDAAYAVFAVGDRPSSAGPTAFSTSVQISADSGAVRSADGDLAVGFGRVTAGAAQATAVAERVRAAGGLVRAARVTARCRNGVVTSALLGSTIVSLAGKVTVAYDIRGKHQDGSTTVIGMQVRLHTGRGTVINVASASCAPARDNPLPPQPVGGSGGSAHDAPARHPIPVADTMVSQLAVASARSPGDPQAEG